MPNIPEIKIGNTTYKLKDAELREEVSDLKSALNDDVKALSAGVSIPQTYDITNWNQGWVRDDGTTGSASNRCRTDFLQFNTTIGVLPFTIKSGYKIQINEYASANVNTFIGRLTNYLTSDALIALDISHRYIITVMKTDETALNVADVPSDVLSYTGYTFTDTTLSVNGKAADAKATGDKINDVLAKNLIVSNNFDELVTSFVRDSSEIKENTTQNNYNLDANGLAYFDSGSKLKKYYDVTPGDSLIITNANVAQFQTSASVPSSGTNTYLVGDVILSSGVIMTKVPVGASYLIIAYDSEKNPSVQIDVREKVAGIIDVALSSMNKTVFSNSDFAVLSNAYIRPTESTIGASSANKVLYAECTKGTNYIIKASIPDLYFSAGFTRVLPASGATVYDKKAISSDWTIVHSDENAKYLVISVAADDVNVSANGYTKIEAPIIPVSSVGKEITVKMEKGKYDNTNDRYAYGVSCTINSYPVVLGDTSNIQIRPFSFSTQTTGNVIFRDQSGATIDTVSFSCENGGNIQVPNGSYYADFEVYNNWVNDIQIVCAYETEQPYQSKRIYVNSNNEMVNYFSVDLDNDLYSAMCYIMPPNYSHDGKSVPLVLWFDGNYNYNTIGSHFSNSKLPGIQYMRDEGFAVVQIYSWGSYYSNKYPNCGQDQPYPTPTCLKCIDEGLKYILDRYNIDPDNVHVLAKSMGGLISLYYVSRPVYRFRSIGMFSPILDMFGLRGRYADARKAIFEDMDFSGDITEFADIQMNGDTSTGIENYYFSERCCQNTWDNNLPKLLKLNSAWTNLVGDTFGNNYAKSVSNANAWYDDMSATDIYDNPQYKKIGNIPTKIWGVTQDDNVPYLAMVEIIKQLQNAGSYAEMRSMESSNHSAFDTGTYGALSGTTALGISFTNVPLGWVEFVTWARKNMPKPITQTVIN